MVDNLNENYVRTARSKGLSERRVVLRHTLRNGLFPVITLLGMYLPALFSGALVVESLFNFPGMGQLFWQAALKRDFPILLGVTVIISVATVRRRAARRPALRRRRSPGPTRAGAPMTTLSEAVRPPAAPEQPPPTPTGRRSARPLAQGLVVFCENRLALVGLGLFVLLAGSASSARSSTTPTRCTRTSPRCTWPPAAGAPARHRRGRLRPAGPAHARRADLDHRRPRRRDPRHRPGHALGRRRRVRRRLGGLGDDAGRRRDDVDPGAVPLHAARRHRHPEPAGSSSSSAPSPGWARPGWSGARR